MAEKLSNFQLTFWKIYNIICGIAAPCFLIMAFSDKGFIYQLSIYMSGFLWLVGAAIIILALSYAHDVRRTSIIEDEREEERPVVKTLDQYATEAVEEEPAKSQSEQDLIDQLNKEWKDRLNYHDYMKLKRETPGYTKLHNVILNHTKTWTRGENVNRERNKPRGHFNKKQTPTPIVLNPHL